MTQIKTFFLPFIMTACLALPVQAEELAFSCSRLASKCKATQCDALKNSIKADSSKVIFSKKKTAIADYRIGSKEAVEKTTVTLPASSNEEPITREVLVTFNSVNLTPDIITLQNKNSKNQVTETIEIERANGFYSYYLLHIDGSMKDIPLGAPYSAYFGWCDTVPPPVVSVK